MYYNQTLTKSNNLEAENVSIACHLSVSHTLASLIFLCTLVSSSTHCWLYLPGCWIVTAQSIKLQGHLAVM